MALINETEQDTSGKHKQHFSIDLRVVVVLLLLIIGAMFMLWKPWTGNAADARTIEVRGEATLTAKPDEFVFFPSYQFENADKNVALNELSTRSDEIVAKLKEIGVSESDIKTSSNTHGSTKPMPDDTEDTTYTLQFTVTVGDTQLAQKVQDYLAGTAPTGSVSPQASFSDAKRKELEDKARVEALKDSKKKADQTARELGFKVDKVKTVTDGAFTIFPSSARGMEAGDTASSLAIHAGENELPYSVTVVYFIN